MVHNRKDLLELLLEALDDDKNDIYLHIDSRCKEYSFSDFHTDKAGLYNVDSMKVYWGDYSQVACELKLLAAATENKHYAYYHFIQNAAYPLRSQDEIHEFYKHADNKLFIQLDNNDSIERVKYYYFLNRLLYKNSKKRNIIHLLHNILTDIQSRLGIDRFKKYGLEYMKGFCCWSITDDFARYVLDNRNLIRKIYRFGFAPDESFMQTLAYNSEYRDRICNCRWMSTWAIDEERTANNFEYSDLDLLLNSDADFARKFEGKDGIRLIEEIKKSINHEA